MRIACGTSDGREEDCEELERDSFMKESALKGAIGERREIQRKARSPER